MLLLCFAGNKLWNLEWDPLGPTVKEEELRSIVEAMFYPLDLVLDSNLNEQRKLTTLAEVQLAESTLENSSRANQVYVSRYNR